jgi:hypothetical protein
LDASHMAHASTRNYRATPAASAPAPAAGGSRVWRASSRAWPDVTSSSVPPRRRESVGPSARVASPSRACGRGGRLLAGGGVGRLVVVVVEHAGGIVGGEDRGRATGAAGWRRARREQRRAVGRRRAWRRLRIRARRRLRAVLQPATMSRRQRWRPGRAAAATTMAVVAGSSPAHVPPRAVAGRARRGGAWAIGWVRRRRRPARRPRLWGRARRAAGWAANSRGRSGRTPPRPSLA